LAPAVDVLKEMLSSSLLSDVLSKTLKRFLAYLMDEKVRFKSNLFFSQFGHVDNFCTFINRPIDRKDNDNLVPVTHENIDSITKSCESRPIVNGIGQSIVRQPPAELSKDPKSFDKSIETKCSTCALGGGGGGKRGKLKTFFWVGQKKRGGAEKKKIFFF